MTAVETVQRFEYEQASEITRVRWLAEQGWQLHSVVPCGGNIVYLMERPTDGGLVAERDAALSRAAEAQRCLSVLRGQVRTVASSAVMIPGPAMDNALLADRDRLAREAVGLRRDLAVAEEKVDGQAWDGGSDGQALTGERGEAMTETTKAQPDHALLDAERYATGVMPADAEWQHAEQAYRAADKALAALVGENVPEPVRDAVYALGDLVSIWQGYGEETGD